MKRKTWKDVDWVELGCRGWEIDESGAGVFDPPEFIYRWGEGTVAYEGQRATAHLDFATLDLFLEGPPDWVERVVNDLRAANALKSSWYFTPLPTFDTGTVTAGSLTGAYLS